METIQIEKRSFEALMSKIDEIHKHNADKSLMREAIEILESAIALNVSESTIYRVLNGGDTPPIINNEILKRRVQCNVSFIEDSNSAIDNNGVESNFKWTGSKSEIVEVVESILLIGNINNGNVSKKEFYEFIGNLLQVDLSNHNNILDSISRRKDDLSCDDRRIRFLPKLTNVISQRLQERDSK